MDSPQPWKPNTSPKQDELRWMAHPNNPDKKRYLCISGPRKSSKTYGSMNVICEHLWEVDRAKFGIISPTVTAAADGGCWELITGTVIPHWIEGDFGFEWIDEPFQEGVSKKLKCSIRNKHGTKSVLQLESFREGATEKEVGARFKGKEFSGLYWSEVGTWVRSRMPFDVIIDCFRGRWKRNEYIMLLDTNPEPPGEDHWIYQMFYKFRTADRSTIEQSLAEQAKLHGDNVPSVDLVMELQKNLGLIEFFVSDNPYLDKRDVDELKAKFYHNRDLWDRYYLGKWTNAAGDGLFSDVFRPNLHTAGEIETPLNPNPQILLPNPETYELHNGWDPGVTNYATVIVEQIFWPNDKGIEVPHFNVIDELVFIDSDLAIGEFTQEFMLKREWWERQQGKQLRWADYADRSVFDMRESISDRRQHVEVYNASGGKIRLIAVEKGDGSVRQRVDILRKLLFQNRIMFSKAKCPHTIEAVQSLKKGKSTPVDKTSRFKHAFDALTYVLSTLCYEELFRGSKAVVAKPSSPKHVQISL